MRVKNVFASTAVMALVAALPLAVAATPAAAQEAGGGYGGNSSGDVIFANALSTEDQELARTALAQSAAGVGIGQPLVTVDTLGSRILFADPAGKNAYGHGAGLNIGIGQAPSDEPQGTLALAEALSPPPTDRVTDTVVDVPDNPLVTADVLEAEAEANTTSLDNPCLVGDDRLVSEGLARAADAAALDPPGDDTPPLVQLGGTSESISQVLLADPAAGAAGFGLTTQTTQTLAPLTLLAGTPLEARIRLLHDIRLRATAGGVAGSGEVFYGFVDDDGNEIADQRPVVSVTVGGETQTLTSEQVLGPEGVRLQLGVLDVIIGGPATREVAADGTSARGTADFIRITAPGETPTGEDPVFSGPLDPLNQITSPLLDGLSPVLDPIRQALIDAGLEVADLRVLHVESLATVPAGGIICPTPTPAGPGDPLAEAMKDVSTNSVAPGGTFDYTVRFPNRGSEPLTDVRVVDTFSQGLEFVSASGTVTPDGGGDVRTIPAPTQQGNVLTFQVGTVEPNAFVDIRITFRVPEGTADGTEFRNDARIFATFRGAEITKDVSVEGPTVSDTFTGPCDVSRSTKFASNLQVRTGDQFAYFINVSNTGAEPCTNVTITDDLVDGVEFVSCSDDCTSEGRRVTFEIGTLNGGSAKTVSIVVKVTATSGTLPNAALIQTSEGSTARPTTPGPTVTDVSVVSPGEPAGCPATGCPRAAGPAAPNDRLPRTGAAAALPALGALALAGGLAVRRRQRTDEV